MSEIPTPQTTEFAPPSLEAHEQWVTQQQQQIEASEARAERLNQTVEEIQHKQDLYAKIGATTMMVVERGNVDQQTRENAELDVRPQTAVERYFDKRAQKRAFNLEVSRAKKKTPAALTGQTYGLRVGLRQRSRISEAKQKYKTGEITAAELESEKNTIKATRNQSQVRGSNQRSHARDGAARAFIASVGVDQPITDHLRDFRKNSALAKSSAATADAQRRRQMLDLIEQNNDPTTT